MSVFDDTEIISKYTLEQAVEDGVLVEIVKKRWKELSGGKPIVATAHICEEISLAGFLEIWNEYVIWRRKSYAGSGRKRQAFSDNDEWGGGLGHGGQRGVYHFVSGGLLARLSAIPYLRQ